MTSSHPTLARILDPLPVEAFLRDHWERAPLVLRRDRPGAFAGLLSLDDIDRYLGANDLHHPAVSLVDHRRKIAVEEYTFPSGLIDVVKLFKLYDAGATMVFAQLEAHHRALFECVRALEGELSTRFQANIYLTPGNAKGFHPHYDSHDVFVAQVEGSKHWMLYDTPIELPLRRQEFDPKETACGALSREFDLDPGDVLYIPRGLMHDARTAEGGGHSLHVTFGALFTSWTDLLVEALGRWALSDVHGRRALPPGFAREASATPAAKAHLVEALRRFAASAEADADGLLEHFARDLVETRHARVPGQFAQLAGLDALTVDSAVGVRPGVVLRVDDEGERVTLTCHGTSLTFPAHAAEALRFAVARERYTARDLPSALDDAGRLVLLKKLIREGVLRAL
jgi:ribosomal protein L16 Arg81 hydroxylase